MVSQAELELPRPAFTVETVARIETGSQAIRETIRESSRCAKSIQMDLEIDAGQFSRILKGDAHFPQDKFLQLFQAADNELFVDWLCFRTGTTRVRLETEKDRIIREQQERITELETQHRVVKEFMREIK